VMSRILVGQFIPPSRRWSHSHFGNFAAQVSSVSCMPAISQCCTPSAAGARIYAFPWPLEEMQPILLQGYIGSGSELERWHPNIADSLKPSNMGRPRKGARIDPPEGIDCVWMSLQS
jgi:hypothetical protein